MTRININLEDGLPPVSFDLSNNDVIRFCKFMDEYNMAMKENEIMKKQIDGLRDQIMNLPCLDRPGVERNSQIAYKTGHRDARHAAAELVAMIEAETKNESPAIERDIPVQPKLITATREDFDDTFECPSCAKRFSSFDEFDFCPWCGQRLDWSE